MAHSISCCYRPTGRTQHGFSLCPQDYWSATIRYRYISIRCSSASIPQPEEPYRSVVLDTNLARMFLCLLRVVLLVLGHNLCYTQKVDARSQRLVVPLFGPYSSVTSHWTLRHSARCRNLYPRAGTPWSERPSRLALKAFAICCYEKLVLGEGRLFESYKAASDIAAGKKESPVSYAPRHC